MRGHKRAAALVLCAGMLALLLISSACLAHEADHHCSGEDCPVCAFIAQAVQLQRSFALAAAAVLLPAVFAAAGRFRCGGNTCGMPAFTTPVRLKIRLND